MTFDVLGLESQLVCKLSELGISEPTPIQQKAIPIALEGGDVMGIAQTGTGKTAAFGLPMVQNLLATDRQRESRVVRGLVLAPTRELAKQIADNLKAYTKGTPLKVGLVVGGASINAQMTRLLRGADILVATPGRLIDLMERNAVRLDKTEYLVLDEADQMLDLGFIHALRRIAEALPEARQTMLFSATMPKLMAELAQAFLRNPTRVEVSPPGRTADKIKQELHFIAQGEKTGLLIEHLGEHPEALALVFLRTKHGAERLAKTLAAKGFAVEAIHGNKSQGQRQRAITATREGEVKVLVATDVAARGLDIPTVRYVYNYDLPNVADNYVHRIGRTARAGRDGTAVAYCAPSEMSELKAIQKTIGTDIPVASGSSWRPSEEEKKPPRRRGRRPSGGGGAKPAGKTTKPGAAKGQSQGKGQHRGARDGGAAKAKGRPQRRRSKGRSAA